MRPVASSAEVPAERGPLLIPATIGIRHLSPAGALAVERTLERVRPTCVLLEAPSGAERILTLLADAQTRPPVALLAFTVDRPVRSFTYPLAGSSPEWAATRWAVTHGADLRCIDLPAEVFLALDTRQGERAPEATRQDAYEAFAQAAGAPDFETWWERNLEHLQDPETYRAAAWAFGEGVRALRAEPPTQAAETLLREAFMRRAIREAVAAGHAPERCVVLCGAFHAPVLTRDLPSLGDDQLAALPRAPAHLTLMPYSHARLHARAGYGAGNLAPAYFTALKAALEEGHPEAHASRFLTGVARAMRAAGHPRAPAQIIDAAALARMLATMAGSPVITLRELRDAALTCFGQGERTAVAHALDATETGEAVGALPPGSFRTPLQDDFAAEVARLGLEPHLVDRSQLLELDLREDHRKVRASAALRDRERSAFLHRSEVSGLGWGEPTAARAASTTSWKEGWRLRWSPALELRLAELSLEGDSLAEVAARALEQRLEAARGAGDVADVLERAGACQLTDVLVRATEGLQAAATRDDSLPSVARATEALHDLMRFGGLRAIDPAPLQALLGQLFLRALLLAPAAVHVAPDAAAPIGEALLALGRTATLAPAHVDVARFEALLTGLALQEAGSPLLRGLCCALALERGVLAAQPLSALLSRRLSPGAAVDEAAGFFEGLTLHNRLALLTRDEVWRALDAYVAALDGPGFVHALVPLRRAFSTFTGAELRNLAARLGHLWGAPVAVAALQGLTRPLGDSEAEALSRALEGLEDLDL